jgi:hypothetical protein
MKPTLRVLSTFFLLSFVIFSCSKSDSGDVTPASVVGTWTLTKTEGTAKLTKETTTKTLSKTELDDLVIFSAEELTFKSDGTFTTDDEGFFGTYKVSGNELTMTVKVDGLGNISQTRTIAVSGSSLVFTTSLKNIKDLYTNFINQTDDVDLKSSVSTLLTDLTNTYSEITIKETYTKK